jgi:uncharacterized membrane protein YqjE
MTMGESGPPSSGILASLRRMADTVLSSVHNRIELFALELAEEKHWLIKTLLWTAGTIFFGVLAVTFLTLTVILLSPDEAKRWILVLFCAIYIGLFLGACTGLRRLLKDKSPPMSDTLAELKKDITWLRSKD